ncbi:MAG: LytR/AlgR family response regulator transcription factor [Saprospiraceae bacterium]
MKVVLIDDEKPALLRLNDLISTTPQPLEIVGEASTGSAALDLIHRVRPDAIFLDIQLMDMTGFDLLAALTINPFVIFTTAYQDFALKAFDYYAIDYLLKPIQQARFDLAMEKLTALRTQTASNSFAVLDQWVKQQNQQAHAFPIKEKDRIHLVNFEEMVYLKAADKYVELQLENGKQHLLSKTLQQLALELPPSFIRVHRSFIVNKKFVYEIQRFFKSRFILKLNDKQRSSITTSEKYAEVVKSAFNI